MERSSKQESFQEKVELPVEVRPEKGFDWMMRHRIEYSDIEDDEALLWCALAADHPEMREHLLAELKKNKTHIQNPEQLLERVRKDMAESEDEELNHNPESQVWAEKMPEVQVRIDNLLTHFSPANAPERLQIVPSDRFPNSAGRAMRVLDMAMIFSNAQNLDNLEHEFLHTFLNEVIEQMLVGMSPQELVVIYALCGNDLRKEYGENSSLVYEEFIRTYNRYVEKGERPETRESFKERLAKVTEEDYQSVIKNNSRLATRLDTMDIRSLDQLKARADEYYDLHEKDEMRDKLIKLYESYGEAKKVNPTLEFSGFLQQNGRGMLLE